MASYWKTKSCCVNQQALRITSRFSFSFFVIPLFRCSGDQVVLPELLDEILALLDDVDGDLQRGLLLLAEAFDQILHGFHRLGVDVVQQLLLQLLQPCPQLEGRRREKTYLP